MNTTDTPSAAPVTETAKPNEAPRALVWGEGTWGDGSTWGAAEPASSVLGEGTPLGGFLLGGPGADEAAPAK